ncbi:MAG: tRNA (guanosine(46)-N7)-methyltransferase TrmB [Bacteroidota bacterium]|nr:tRNA (guanosine(46)-N7)-methyltransferase TrmB [Bacteroidota bacterium]
MAKNKLKKFAEINTFSHVVQPSIEELKNDFPLKGKWKKSFFKNSHPLVLELACGKGEYSVEFGTQYPNKNFLGIDIKGARLWAGAKTVSEDKLRNVGFLRTRIEFIEYCFARQEIDEIWIIFPDPHEKESSINKRLTHNNFLFKYNQILKKNGVIHLKTDNINLYQFTLETISSNKHNLIEHTPNLYTDKTLYKQHLGIRTHYENIFLNRGKQITYIKFSLK